MEGTRVEEGSTVLLCKDGVYKAVKLFKGRKVNFNRLFFLSDSAIGQPFGGKFEIKRQHLVAVEADELLRQEDEEEEGDSKRSNRGIVDDAASQKLSYEEIQKMKKSGCSGQDILDSVVQNSASYSERTKFSQEKYIKKKAKKHIPVVTILKPSTRLLCAMYSARGASKICHMRYDTVAQMLTLGNVRAHSNMIVVETCQGLLLGAVLERMGGYGKLVHIFFGDLPVKTALDSFSHLPNHFHSPLTHYPLHRLASLADQTPPGPDTAGRQPTSPVVVVAAPRCDSTLEQCHDDDTAMEDTSSQDAAEEEDDEREGEEGARPAKRQKLQSPLSATDRQRIDEEKQRRREERNLMYRKSGELLQTRNMDGLLIASRFHPEAILMHLLDYVAPSRPIVVYSQFQETLVQCYQKLKESGKVFDMQLIETWTRQYQVLPGRTHPEVNMNAQSGYILFGTTTKHYQQQ